jgi:glucokinase
MTAGGPEHDDLILAVDIGGTKLAAALVSGTGSIVRSREIPTPSSELGPDPLTAALADLAAGLAAGAAPTMAAIAAAGPLDAVKGLISPVNIPAWRDFDVVSCVSDAVGGVPTALVGDAIAAAVGEAWIGAAAGSRALLGIVVSTGVGGGLVLDGAPFLGPTGNAGHFGHIPVGAVGAVGAGDSVGRDCPDLPVCGCGARGCIEAIASGPAILAFAQGQGWPGLDVPELGRAAAQGSSIALAAFDRAADALATGIIAGAVLCDLDTVVVGGGVSAVGEVLLAPLRAKVAERTKLSFTKKTRIVPASLGRRSGLIGAAGFALSCRTAAVAAPAEVASMR